MTDTNQSGAPAAPVADNPASAARAETPAGSFGSTRGSGLARGKRPSGAAAPTAPVKSDYKPTTIEVITHEREYKNPFASPEPANPPAAEPAKIEAPAPVAEEPTVDQAPVAAAEAQPEEPAPKPEIQILPPAESIRPAVKWEASTAAPSHQESAPGDRPDRPQYERRPSFRADRPEDRNGGREPRREGGPRQFDQGPRHEQGPRQFEQRPRHEQGSRQEQGSRYEQGAHASRPQPAAQPAPKGFLAWLKGLFGGSKAPEIAPVREEVPGESFGDGHRHRRRHRGGRGHGGPSQGYRGGRPQEGDPNRPAGENEHRGGDRQGGNRRRRHRGGQGRDRGGEPRSEGQQGGGAI